jgi:hypothetical protein
MIFLSRMGKALWESPLPVYVVPLLLSQRADQCFPVQWGDPVLKPANVSLWPFYWEEWQTKLLFTIRAIDFMECLIRLWPVKPSGLWLLSGSLVWGGLCRLLHLFLSSRLSFPCSAIILESTQVAALRRTTASITVYIVSKWRIDHSHANLQSFQMGLSPVISILGNLFF